MRVLKPVFEGLSRFSALPWDSGWLKAADVPVLVLNVKHQVETAGFPRVKAAPSVVRWLLPTVPWKERHCR